MKRIAFLLLLVGCTESDVPSIAGDGGLDGGGGDTTTIDTQTLCGASLPTTAPPSIRTSGQVVVVDPGPTPTMGITVELWKRGGTEPLAMTRGFGNFEFTAYTQSVPLDAYLHASELFHSDLYYFFPIPLSRNYFLDELPMFSENDFGAIAPRETGTGVIMVAMHDDCNGTDKPVTGAAVSISPAISSTTTRYVSASSSMPTFQAAPDSTTAGAIVVNVPPGEITISTANATRALRTARVSVFANSLTMVDLYPQ